MPYKTIEEAEKDNKGLRKYSEKAKRGWIGSFNGCMEDGGPEDKCFAIAYSVANKVDGREPSSKKSSMTFDVRIMKKVADILEGVHSGVMMMLDRNSPKRDSGGLLWEYYSTGSSDTEVEARVYIKGDKALVDIIHIPREDGTAYREVMASVKGAVLDDNDLISLIKKAVREAKPEIKNNMIRYSSSNIDEDWVVSELRQASREMRAIPMMEEIKALKLKAVVVDFLDEVKDFKGDINQFLKKITSMVENPKSLNAFPELKEVIDLSNFMKKGVLKHTFMSPKEIVERMQRVVQLDA